jgi:iron complex transport system permease protein
LGARVDRIRLTVVIAATLGTSAVVSVSGLIGFVGIVVPHLVRLLAGASYRRLLPLSILAGAAFLIVADIPGRVLSDPAETPIGVVTAFLGAPFFILVLRSRQSEAR